MKMRSWNEISKTLVLHIGLPLLKIDFLNAAFIDISSEGPNLALGLHDFLISSRVPSSHSVSVVPAHRNQRLRSRFPFASLKKSIIRTLHGVHKKKELLQMHLTLRIRLRDCT